VIYENGQVIMVQVYLKELIDVSQSDLTDVHFRSSVENYIENAILIGSKKQSLCLL